MNDEQIYEQAFDLWKANKDRIVNGYYRGKQQDLFDSIALFLRIISKVNDVEYNPNWKEIDFSLYKLAPINFAERFNAIVTEPFTGYLYLVGLFEELEKIILNN